MTLAGSSIPELTGTDRLRVIFRYKRDPLGTLRWICGRYGDIASLRIAGQRLILLRKAEHVEHVLMNARVSYTKRVAGYDEVRPLLGNGLITSEDPLWRQQRMLMQPNFHRKYLTKFASKMSQVASESAEEFTNAAKLSEEVDLLALMQKATLRVLGLTLLNIDISSKGAHRVSSALGGALGGVARRIRNHLNMPMWIPTRNNIALLRAIKALDRELFAIIAARREKLLQGDHPDDLLGMLMESVDERSEGRMDDKQLRDEAMTLFLAGHETTASALSWCFLLICQHPEIEDKLRSEFRDVLSNRLVSYDDLPKLQLTRCIVKETLRLYPPIPIMGRFAEHDDVIDGYHIPAGSRIVISPYLTQRDPRYWPDPDVFDPSRFLNAGQMPPRGSYIPFIDGPRRCIGEQFALMEMEIFLATILPRVRFQYSPKGFVAPETSVTLRPHKSLTFKPELMSS